MPHTMTPITKRSLAAALAAALCAPVYAQSDFDPYGYVGGDFGYFRVETEEFPNDDDEVKDNRFSYKLRAGGRINEVLGLEAGFTDFGEVEDGSSTYTADGYTLAALGHIPLGERASIYGKLGQFFWDSEAESGPFRRTNDGNDTFYGVGLELPVGEATTFNLGYDRYTLEDTDVDLASAGLNLQFGQAGY